MIHCVNPSPPAANNNNGDGVSDVSSAVFIKSSGEQERMCRWSPEPTDVPPVMWDDREMSLSDIRPLTFSRHPGHTS